MGQFLIRKNYPRVPQCAGSAPGAASSPLCIHYRAHFTAHSGPRSGPLAVATAGALAPRSHLGRLRATARARRRGELEQYEPESSGTHDAFDCAELVFPLDLELEKQYPGLPAYIAVL